MSHKGAGKARSPQARYAERIRLAHREAGLCRCGQPRAPDKSKCQPCLDYHAAYHRRRREEAKAGV